MKQKLLLYLVVLQLFIVGGVAQTINVKGTVLDEKNAPVVGATVRLKSDPKKGAATNIDGEFTIKAKENDKLIISFVGYETKEVKVASSLKISLQPNSSLLDEVMVVAFGTTKKAAFTGSATIVSSKDIQKRVTSNVANALVGTVPGIQMKGGNTGLPGESGSFSIRGVKTIGAKAIPLIVVDGSPYSGAFNSIPQSDIENITILKDAASAALYGARGAGGVILITTKKGKKGDATITFDMRIGMNQRSVQEYDRVTDPAEYYEAIYAMNKNYWAEKKLEGQMIMDPKTKAKRPLTDDDVNRLSNKAMLSKLKYNVYDIPKGELLIGQDGKLNPNAKLGRSYTAKVGGEDQTFYLLPDDWTNAAYRPALRQEYNLGIRGGSDKMTYLTSFSYLNDEGILEYTGFRRFNARLKADYQFRSWGKIGANITYTNLYFSNNPDRGTSYGATNMSYFTDLIAPIYPIYVRGVDKEGNPYILKDKFGRPRYDFGKIDYEGLGSRPFANGGNPLGANLLNKSNEENDRLNGVFTFDVNFTDYLKLNVTSSLNLLYKDGTEYRNGLYGSAVGVNGELSRKISRYLKTNNIQTMTFFKKFNGHYINAMIGHEYYYSEGKLVSGKRQGGFSPDILELDAFAQTTKAGSNKSQYNVEGFFANLQYDWKNRYFTSASYRRDATSTFHKDRRWGDFWSIGGAWLISQEEFMAPARKWVDLLKIKVSIGQQGNDNIGDYKYIDTYLISQNTPTTMSPVFSSLANPSITWETTTNSNIGLEFNLFGNRLNGTFDLYNKATNNLLFWVSVPESNGVRGHYDNVGNIASRGFELSLSGSIIRNKLVDWSLFGNISHNRSIITSLPEEKIKNNGGYIDQNYWFAIGGDMYNRLIRKFAGVNEKGQALYYYDKDLRTPAPDGKYLPNMNLPSKKMSGTTTNADEATLYEMGTSLPLAFGGFGTTLKIGDFDATLQFDYQIGGKIYDYRYSSLTQSLLSDTDYGRSIHKDWKKAWSPENKDSNMPRWQFGDKHTNVESDRFLTDASYLNFQSITIGYNIPKSWVENYAQIRIYGSGENIGFISKRKGLDPRRGYGSVGTVGGMSSVRTLTAGLQITF